MSVYFNVLAYIFTIRNALFEHTLTATITCNSVNRTIFFVINPGAFNVYIRWIFTWNQSKNTTNQAIIKANIAVFIGNVFFN